MNWNTINADYQVEQIKSDSFSKPQVIFKHSTRCAVSAMAYRRMNAYEQDDKIDYHFLDLLAHRTLSDKIAEQFGVVHESPQVLIIKNGECIYDESHSSIYPNEVVAEALK